MLSNDVGVSRAASLYSLFSRVAGALIGGAIVLIVVSGNTGLIATIGAILADLAGVAALVSLVLYARYFVRWRAAALSVEGSEPPSPVATAIADIGPLAAEGERLPTRSVLGSHGICTLGFAQQGVEVAREGDGGSPRWAVRYEDIAYAEGVTLGRFLRVPEQRYLRVVFARPRMAVLFSARSRTAGILSQFREHGVTTSDDRDAIDVDEARELQREDEEEDVGFGLVKLAIPVVTAVLALWLLVPVGILFLASLSDPATIEDFRGTPVSGILFGAGLYVAMVGLLLAASFWSGYGVSDRRHRRWYAVSILVVVLPVLIIYALGVIPAVSRTRSVIGIAVYGLVAARCVAYLVRSGGPGRRS
jgi:hypothetical protein